MTPLQKIIREEINGGGFISIARYMELALYHPEYGYYMTRDPFGVQGDFTTAPEISQMFGEVIAVWVVDTWMQMGSPAPFQLVECGAGRGTLMHDILRSTRHLKEFNDAVQVQLIECSPHLREIQKEKLSDYTVKWLDRVTDVDSMPTIIIGNEFLDALPLQQYIKRGENWLERVVVNSNAEKSENNIFEFSYQKTEFAGDLPAYGYQKEVICEVSNDQKEFIASVSAKLKAARGAILMVDYGYIKNNGGDTLQALCKHQFADVLSVSGEADITAHVNFKFIEDEILSHGLTSHGIKEQGAFLRHLGIEARARALTAVAFQMEDKERAQACIEDIELSKRRLIDNDKMGSLFKVIAASYGFKLNCAGF